MATRFATRDRQRATRTRWPWAVLAYACAALGIVGVVVPGLPTTPFLLVAAWAASRGSDRLHDWLYSHPRLGPALVDWRDSRAISMRAKLLAVAFLALSWMILAWRGVSAWMLAPLALLFTCIAAFVVTRPRPDR